MRVLQVIDSLEVGGAERIFVMLSNLLYQRNIDVTVILLVADGGLLEELHEEIPVIRLNRKKRFDFKTMKKLVDVMSEYDIVHTHLKHNFRYTCFSAKLFGKSISNIIFHDHSHSFGVKKLSIKHIKDSFFKSVFKPNIYIGVNKENCLWAEKHLKVPQTCIFLLENTIKHEVIEKYERKREGIVIVSNISRIKNLSFAIRLVKELQMSITIYGQIRDHDYHQELLDLIEELNLQSQVTIKSDCKKIQAELYKFEFAIHTSLKETGPLVLIEFLAQGLPFLSYATGQVYEKLKPVIPEFFIDTFDLQSWKQQITVIQNKEYSQIESIYDTYFNETHYYNACLKIYQNIQNS